MGEFGGRVKIQSFFFKSIPLRGNFEEGWMRRILTVRYSTIMHLSMLKAPGWEGWVIHGKLTERAFTWVGILTFTCWPRVGNLTWPPSWKN